MNFNELIQTKGRVFNSEETIKVINGLAKRAADYIVGIDQEIDFCDATESIFREALNHLVERIRSLPKHNSIMSLSWGDEPVEFRVDIAVDDANPLAYTLTITDSHGKADSWLLGIVEFSGGDEKYIELRRIMKRYGFKTPSTPNRKYRVSLMGKEAILSGPELCRLEKDLIASGSFARPLFEPIEETVKNCPTMESRCEGED